MVLRASTVLLALGGLLVACGDDGSPPTDGGLDATTPSDSAADAGEEPCPDDPGAVPPAPTLSAPFQGHRTGRGVLRPTFRWVPVPGCVTYEVQVDDSCAPGAPSSCTFPSPEYVETGLTSPSARPAEDLPISEAAPVGRRYYWRARACAAMGCSPWSEVRYVEVGRAPSDVNGDGYSDLVVGAPGQTSVFVYYGGPTGLAAPYSLRLSDPDVQPGFFGEALTSVGDVNGDGYADLVVGAPRQSLNADQEGHVFVYYGGASGPGPSPSLRLENPDDEEGGAFGAAVASAGDLNGDGYEDLVVGAPAQDAGAEDSGSVFVYYGSGAGLFAAPSGRLDNPDIQALGGFGRAVASAGDLNGDGYADLAVGAPRQGALGQGNVFVFLGGADGVGAPPSARLSAPASESDADFGASLASAGDLNGDGYADLAVGAPRQDAGAQDEGNVFVFFGGAGGVTPTPTVTLDNPDNYEYALFGSGLASAGDLDGDGYADLVVGSRGHDSAVMDSVGATFVYRGGDGGLRAVPSSRLENPDHKPLSDFGAVVASAADFDGDGHADLAIGAPRYFRHLSSEGAVFVYAGRETGVDAASPLRLGNPDDREFGYFGTALGSGS